MADVMSGFQDAAGAQMAFAQGFEDALQGQVNQGLAEQLAFLQAHGQTPEALQYVQQNSDFGDIISGSQGFIPGQATTNAGAAWQAFFAGAPQWSAGQLAQNAIIPNAQLAMQQAQMLHDAQMRAASLSSSGGGGGGGSAGGLTPYQAASLEMRAAEFEAEPERYSRQDELDAARFELEIARFEDEQEQDKAMMKYRLLVQQMIQGRSTRDFNDENADQEAAATARAQEQAAARQAQKAKNRQDYVKAIRAGVNAGIDSANDGLKKNELVSAIMGRMVEFQNDNGGYKFGYTDQKVKALVNKVVNSRWADYRAGAPSTSSGGGRSGGPTNTQFQSTANSAWRALQDDRKFTLQLRRSQANQPNSAYAMARTRMMSALRASNPKWVKRNRQTAINRVNSYLASRGIRPWKRRNA